MGKDLFACNLDLLTFSDVEDFVALGVKESVRVDYKDQVPGKFGDIATAFSNTIGGVVVLGVQNNGGLPGAITGITRNAKSDLKTQIANKIVSTVYPRPEFSIGVVVHAATPGNDVAVVRIEEGAETPYMFLPDKKVSVRIEDQNERASLTDLERLFQRRDNGPGADFHDEDRSIRVLVTHPETQTQVDAETYLKCWMWPTQSLDLRLDRRIERVFHAVVSKAFSDFKEIEIDDRHGSWTDLAFRSHTVADLNARWRLTSNGSVGFVIQPFHSKFEAILLADVVGDVARFMACGSKLMRVLGWQGRINAEAILIAMDRRILPTSADKTEGNEKPPRVLNGIVNIGARTNRGAGAWTETFASPDSISAAAFIADLLMESLRTERRSEVDYDELLASVQKIVDATASRG
jgi:hypothetical protein